MSTIQKLVVKETVRRQGIGKALVLHAISSLKTDVRLHVDVSNSGAIALYKRCLFKVVHVRKDYYSTGRDAYVMEYSSIKL